MTCPGEVELARAITTDDPAIATHAGTCASCRAIWDATRAAIELARGLPVALPPPQHREEIRTALLARAQAPARARRPSWLIRAIALVAAAGVVGYLAVPRGAAPVAAAGHHHGTVHPQPGARYLTGTPAPDEVVVLVDGALDVEVAPLHAGERYRVVVGSAEVEVRGTAFTVTAREARLIGVTVAHGGVEIRSESGAAITLSAGQAWHPAVAAMRGAPGAPIAPVAPVASSRLVPPRVPHAVPRPLPAVTAARHAIVVAPPEAAPVATVRKPEEASYDDAWRALRAQDFARAATGFARVMLLAPDSALVEDASFWHAVALARAKRSAEAVSAFRDFIDGFAQSARASEASTMLGWILVDGRDDLEAARRFRAGLADANPAVRASAQAGLDAVSRR